MGSSCHDAMETNLTRNHEVSGSIPGLAQWVKDLALLWLWCRPAAVALIRPLTWEPPYAMRVALKRQKTKKKKKKKKRVLCDTHRRWIGLLFIHGTSTFPAPLTIHITLNSLRDQGEGLASLSGYPRANVALSKEGIRTERPGEKTQGSARSSVSRWHRSAFRRVSRF